MALEETVELDKAVQTALGKKYISYLFLRPFSKTF